MVYVWSKPLGHYWSTEAGKRRRVTYRCQQCGGVFEGRVLTAHGVMTLNKRKRCLRCLPYRTNDEVRELSPKVRVKLARVLEVPPPRPEGWTTREAAEATGYSRRYVARVLDRMQRFHEARKCCRWGREPGAYERPRQCYWRSNG